MTGTYTLSKGDENTGTVFFIIILNIAEVEVAKSGRVPITLMMQVPIRFYLETNIEPVVGLTLMKSVAATSKCPSE